MLVTVQLVLGRYTILLRHGNRKTQVLFQRMVAHLACFNTMVWENTVRADGLRLVQYTGFIINTPTPRGHFVW